MSYSDDTAAFMFGGLDEKTETVVRHIIHNDGMSADEMMACVAEYEEEWDSVLITERKDLAGAFRTAYMVELRGPGSGGERRSESERGPQANRSLRAGRLV
jgi:hypothetical protein